MHAAHISDDEVAAYAALDAAYGSGIQVGPVLAPVVNLEQPTLPAPTGIMYKVYDHQPEPTPVATERKPYNALQCSLHTVIHTFGNGSVLAAHPLMVGLTFIGPDMTKPEPKSVIRYDLVEADGQTFKTWSNLALAKTMLGLLTKTKIDANNGLSLNKLSADGTTVNFEVVNAAGEVVATSKVLAEMKDFIGKPLVGAAPPIPKAAKVAPPPPPVKGKDKNKGKN